MNGPSLTDLPNDLLGEEILSRLSAMDKLSFIQTCKSFRDIVTGDNCLAGVMGSLVIAIEHRASPKFSEVVKDSSPTHALCFRFAPWGPSWTPERMIAVLGWIARHSRAFSDIAIIFYSSITDASWPYRSFKPNEYRNFVGSAVQYLASARYVGPLTLSLPTADIAYDRLIDQLVDLEGAPPNHRLTAPLTVVCRSWTVYDNKTLLTKLQRLQCLAALEVGEMRTERCTREEIDAFTQFQPPPALTRLLLCHEAPSSTLHVATLQGLTNLRVLSVLTAGVPVGLGVLSALRRLEELDVGSFDVEQRDVVREDIRALTVLSSLTTLRLNFINGKLHQAQDNARYRYNLDVRCIPPLTFPKLAVFVTIFTMQRKFRGKRVAFEAGDMITPGGMPQLRELGVRLDYMQDDNAYHPRDMHMTLDMDPILTALPDLRGIHVASLCLKAVFRMTRLPRMHKLASLVVSGWAGAEIFGLNATLGGPYGATAELRVPPAGSGVPGLVLGKPQQDMTTAEILPIIQNFELPRNRVVGVEQVEEFGQQSGDSEPEGGDVEEEFEGWSDPEDEGEEEEEEEEDEGVDPFLQQLGNQFIAMADQLEDLEAEEGEEEEGEFEDDWETDEDPGEIVVVDDD